MVSREAWGLPSSCHRSEGRSPAPSWEGDRDMAADQTASARTKRAAVVVLLAMTVLTGCIPGGVSGRSHPTGVTTLGEWHVGVLTPDSGDSYSITVNHDTAQVAAPASNTGGNLRLAGARHVDPMTTDHHACVTWSGPMKGNLQPGVTLRTSMSGNRTRAIVVSNNIFYGARGIWNVHYMDSALPGGYVQLAALPLTGPDVPDTPPPWRACAKVESDLLSVKVWPLNQPEPHWSDPRRAGTVHLAPEHVYSGRPGWYAAHVGRGESTSLTDITGYPVSVYQASLEWVDQLSTAMIGQPLPESTRMTYADLVASGDAERVVWLLAEDLTRRERSVCAIFTTTLGRCGAHSVALLDQRGAAGLAAAHFTAAEFSRSRDDRQYVTDLFRRVLLREPSEASIRWHLNHIARYGRDADARNVWSAQEHGDWRAHEAFEAFHGRPPTAEEQRAVAVNWAAAGWDPIVLIGYAGLLAAPA